MQLERRVRGRLLRGAWRIPKRCLADTSSDQVCLPEDLFKQRMCEDDSGRRFIHEGVLDEIRITDLHSLKRRYCDGMVTWGLGRSGTHSLHYYPLVSPRFGFRSFFCLHSLYASLECVSFKRCPSKWSYEGFNGWLNLLQDLGFPEQLLLSFGDLSSSDAMQSTTRFLPTPAISIVGLVVMLVRWGRNSLARGGLRGEHGQQQAKLFLSAILSGCEVGGLQWEMSVGIVSEWSCKWPRQTSGENPDTVLVDPLAVLDLEPWRQKIEAAALPRDDPLQLWWSALQGSVGDDGRIGLAEAFARACAAPSCKALFAVLVWAVAQRAQVVILDSRLSRESPVEVVLNGADNFRPNSKAADFNLARYIEAGASLIGRPLNLSVVTDKAQVKGLNLANAMVVTPAKEGIIMPPQVVGRAAGRVRSRAFLCPKWRRVLPEKILEFPIPSAPAWCIANWFVWCIDFRLVTNPCHRIRPGV